jgi:hypothetical protein
MQPQHQNMPAGRVSVEVHHANMSLQRAGRIREPLADPTRFPRDTLRPGRNNLLLKFSMIALHRSHQLCYRPGCKVGIGKSIFY